MLTIGGFIGMLAGLALAAMPEILPAGTKLRPEGELAPRAHRASCLSLFAVGCFLRLFRIANLPAGISAEEALVGAQAKALWQTGGFLFDGRLTAQFVQWQGESGGPLLATLTAPFVGLMGMTPLATRLPLALLSCAAMPAAYALGKALSGERAARWCLAAYAVCPYFTLMGRMTYGMNAAVFLMPVAVFLLTAGTRKCAALYAGVLLTGLLCYAQDMFFFLSPAFIIASCMVAAAYGGLKKRHALGAAALGLVVCIPALLTLAVNLGGREGFTWLGFVEIPKLEAFDKGKWLFSGWTITTPADVLSALNNAIDKLWSVVIGGVFQVVAHENVPQTLFAPGNMLALYTFSVPLILLGALSLAMRRLRGERRRDERTAARATVTALACVTLVLLTLFGTEGTRVIDGTTSAPDLSAFFLFDTLLMAAGLCRVARRSRLYYRGLTTLFAAGFVALCLYLFGGSYQEGANVYFGGFGELACTAAREQERTGARVVVTENVYPHREPNAAAEFMYLYATDADMEKAPFVREKDYEIRYFSEDMQPEAGTIYLARPNDTLSWDYEGFVYREEGGFLLLTPEDGAK